MHNGSRKVASPAAMLLHSVQGANGREEARDAKARKEEGDQAC
jgi:hypothetical protein